MFRKQLLILAVTVLGGLTVFSASAAGNSWGNWICQSSDNRVAPQIYEHVTYYKALDQYASFASQVFHQLGDPGDAKYEYRCVNRV